MKAVSIRTTHVTAALLVALWLVSWGLSYVHLGRASVAVALGIAGVKALLVALVFMELVGSKFSVQAAAISALALVAVLMSLTLLDVETRAEAPLLPAAVKRGASP